MPIRFLLRCLAVTAALGASACTPPKTQLEQVLERGELRVVTRNGPTTYFQDRDGDTGIEFEMAQRFASDLGVRLRVIVAGNVQGVVEAVSSGRADIAAAALTKGFVEHSGLAAGPSYQWVTHQVVYRNGRRAPVSIDDIFPDQLHLMAGSLPPGFLEALQKAHPRLSWYIHQHKDSDDLLDMIESGKIAYTVLPSNELAHARQIRPEIRAALNLTPPEPLVWAFRGGADRTLVVAANSFLDGIEQNGVLGKLLDRFYGPAEYFNYVDSREFVKRYSDRLPRYRALFEETAEKYDLDWRLLAAVSYQESHWEMDARSPTGVRGLMMLTHDTARQVGVSNRLDPGESLRGGAEYLKEMLEKIPDHIHEPDRTWFALAAYNVGYGHVEDARVLTQRLGEDPDSWQDVRKHLPLLSHKSWYQKTAHGYARGHEPVRYVRWIRRYYDALVQLTQQDTTPPGNVVEAAIVKPVAL